LLLLVAALADPRWGTRVEDVPSPQSQLVVAVDVSRSMLARDVEPSRFEFARTLVRPQPRDAAPDTSLPEVPDLLRPSRTPTPEKPAEDDTKGTPAADKAAGEKAAPAAPETPDGDKPAAPETPAGEKASDSNVSPGEKAAGTETPPADPAAPAAPEAKDDAGKEPAAPQK
jgi:hypothetical protein